MEEFHPEWLEPVTAAYGQTQYWDNSAGISLANVVGLCQRFVVKQK